MFHPTTEPEHMRFHKRLEVDALTDKLIADGYSFIYNGTSYKFDTSQSSLAKLSVAYNVALQYKAIGQPYSQAMVMQDYQVIDMDRDSIITNYEAMIAYGLGLYSQHASIISSLNDMTYEQLIAWVDPRI